MSNDQSLLETLREKSQLLQGAPHDYDALLEQIGDAQFVLLGEASHGTHEFYRARAEISKRLIAEKGFAAVAVEADWPDAYRVNCYVRGQSEDNQAHQALSQFKRFPTWMWRNTEVVEFIDWLHDHNAALPADTSKAGFYGIDLYSLYGSMEAVLSYLDRTDPQAAQRARERYACFEQFAEDTQAYGYAASFGLSSSCEDEVVHQLLELQQNAADYADRDGKIAADKYFYAEQNARLVKNSEEYYRTMFSGRASSWNLRDTHMADTLDALAQHLSTDKKAKLIVWAHNSHLGDARATEMGTRGELNVGQLVRERHAGLTFSLGFSTHSGTVTAASDWDKPAERKRVRPGLEGSYEALFHEVGGDFWLNLHDADLSETLGEPRLERAIGVVYRPETERWSHYFHATLSHQFDAVAHFDQTRALEPLEPSGIWHRNEEVEVPKTFPFGV